MAPTDQSVINLRIIIEQPVIGVLHSLQAKDESPLDPNVRATARRSCSMFRSV
jgi:hypothetical protein